MRTHRDDSNENLLKIAICTALARARETISSFRFSAIAVGLILLLLAPLEFFLVLSGSGRKVLDDNFKEYDMWLAAENGMFLHHSKGECMTTMPEHLNMEWVDSVKHVFEYFTERTPWSHFDFEERETSLVWNDKDADIEFGKLQARDMLQHLWTGPISNSSVEVVQGSRSVEVRAVGVTKLLTTSWGR